MAEKSKITTIKLSKETKARLEHVKEYKRESYEEVLQKMLEILNICKINPLRARAHLIAIDRKNRAKSVQQKRLKPQIKPQIRQPIKPLTLKPLISPSARQQ